MKEIIKTKRDATIESLRLLEEYVVEAQRLIDILNAFDGPGIPYSDARDAFMLLRKIAKRKPV